MNHVDAYLDSHRDLEVSVSYLWLPMYPRFVEARALPGLTAELADPSIAQYWDDERQLGREFRQRILPSHPKQIVWDTFVLFDAGATWADADEHVLGWGYTVVRTRERLFALLEGLP